MKTNNNIKTTEPTAEEKQKQLDKETIISLHKVISPTAQQQEQIYQLYKKYVDQGARPPKGNCNGCGNSIVSYWRGLCNWYNQNKNLF